AMTTQSAAGETPAGTTPSAGPPAPNGQQPTTPPVPVPAAGDDAIVKLTPAQLKQRLDETRSSAESALLKSLGYESKAAAERASKAFKEWQESQLSEQQKLTKRVEELTPHAERAPALEALANKLVASRLASLPEKLQEVIKSRAQGVEEMVELLDMFE